MNEEAVLTILRTSTVDDIPGLRDEITRLESLTNVRLKSDYVPTVVGSALAGDVIQIILSDPVQALKTVAEIGILLWGILKSIKLLGKHVHFTKKLTFPLLISKSKDDSISDGCYDDRLFNKAKVWGPMEIDSIDGPFFEYSSSEIEALVPFAMLMAVVVPIHKNRSRTYWNILKADGNILGSWTTQTFTEKLPDFLKPL